MAGHCYKDGWNGCSSCFNDCTPAQAGCNDTPCPTSCGYGGGTVDNGTVTGSCGCGQKSCSATAPCCDVNAWGACSVSCGTGVQYNGCGTPRACTVTVCSPWWQVKDADVTTNGDLNSHVPVTAGLYFDTVGNGGYPGIPTFGGSTNLTGAGINVSTKGWLAASGYSSTKIYNSAYFLNSVPANTIINSLGSSIDGSAIASGGTATNGVYWYEYDPLQNGGLDLTINTAANIGSRKVILIAGALKDGVIQMADVSIKGNINLTKGSGFFLLVAKNIIVDPGVGGAGPNLEGIYVADGQFQTGVAATQLWVRGTTVAYDTAKTGTGIMLQRDLAGLNSTTPAELFEYAPDLELLFPEQISARTVNWQEVAP